MEPSPVSSIEHPESSIQPHPACNMPLHAAFIRRMAPCMMMISRRFTLCASLGAVVCSLLLLAQCREEKPAPSRVTEAPKTETPAAAAKSDAPSGNSSTATPAPSAPVTATTPAPAEPEKIFWNDMLMHKEIKYYNPEY